MEASLFGGKDGGVEVPTILYGECMAMVLLCKTCRSVLIKIDLEGWFCEECDALKLKGDSEHVTTREPRERRDVGQ